MKVGVIGVGAVGSAATMALLARGCAREVVLVDQNTKRANGVALDMDYVLPLLAPVDLRAGGPTTWPARTCWSSRLASTRRPAAPRIVATRRDGCAC